MAGKVQRQQVIGKLIGSHAVTNQPQLVELLADEGIAATQATVSRDLEDLGAVKVRVPGGETVYAIPEYEPARIAPEDQLRRVLGEWVAEVKVSANLVVLRTPPGCAHVVASAIDRSGMTGLIGTVAGDDTLMCVAEETFGGPGPGRPPTRTGGSSVTDNPPPTRKASTAGGGGGVPATSEEVGVGAPTGKALWHGRFEGGPAAELMAFTESLSFDRRLWPDDIAGSIAHVLGLAHSQIISDCRICLDRRRARADRLPNWAPEPSSSPRRDEDIHTAIERRVTEIAGPTGAKLHTGRSRNDQSATNVRLWMKRELTRIAERIVDLQAVLLDRARTAGEVYLPGYTHMQRAQPVLLAHHLLAHGWALGRDVERILDSMERIDVSPLGAGALAGSSLPTRPGIHRRQARVRRALRELARRSRVPGSRRRSTLRPDADRHQPVADR